MKRKKVCDTETFIKRAKEVHGDRYDYSRTKYTRSTNKVIITCPEHGEFEQKANNHLMGNGCPFCSSLSSGDRSRTTFDDFIKRAKEVHGDRYDYSRTKYNRLSKKATIICPDHGEFEQILNNHLKGCGCPQCAVEARKNSLTHDKEFFIKRAKEVHGDRYDYSRTKYIKLIEKVEIVCPEHGSFWQNGQSHIRGSGCPTCASENTGQKLSMGFDDFLNKSRIIHDDYYDYSRVVYKNNKTKVEIVCPEHGSFWQTPDGHLSGRGCHRCTSNVSIGEKQLLEYIQSIVGPENVNSSDRHLIAPKELDIVIPSHKLAIEFNGLYWHSEKMGCGRRYHLDKTEACEAAGYRLIHIYEDEWSNKEQRIKDFFANLLGADSVLVSNARDMEVRWNIEPSVYRDFLNQHHIQGHANSSTTLALIDEQGRVRAAMGFSNRPENRETLLSRFCTHGRVRGAFSRLFKHFMRENPGEAVISYADRRYSQGHVYDTAGFEYAGCSEPSFDYVCGPFRYNRRRFQKHKLPKLMGADFDPDKTESQNMATLGYYRLWNCGYKRYVYDDNGGESKFPANSIDK